MNFDPLVKLSVRAVQHSALEVCAREAHGLVAEQTGMALGVCTEILGRSCVYPRVVEKPSLVPNALKRG